MDVDNIDCEVVLWKRGVAQKVAKPGESRTSIGDRRSNETSSIRERLYREFVGRYGAWNGHARRSPNTEIRLIETEDGIGAIVCNGVRYGGRPLSGKGGIVVEEKRNKLKREARGSGEDATRRRGVGCVVIVV